MSADRELLELAIQATNRPYHWDGDVIVLDEPYRGECSSWNPLTDDGDALRLAVALNMDIGQGYEMAFANTTLLAAPDQEYCEKTDKIIDRVRLPGERTENIHVEASEEYAAHCGDKMAATRRAILCAAADVGRAMPCAS